MKIKSYKVIAFEDTGLNVENKIVVPEGAIYQGLNVLPSGIYGVYLIPEIETDDTKIETFILPTGTTSIDPDKNIYCDVVQLPAPPPPDAEPGTEHLLILYIFKNK